MLMERERYEIVRYGKEILSRGLTFGISGNLSIYDPATGNIAISPEGISFSVMNPEDVVIIDRKGNLIEGTRVPSSEHALHAAIYECRLAAKAVVHMHPKYCTTLACMRVPLKAVHYALAPVGVTTVPSIPFHTYGTLELAADVQTHIGNSNAVLLENHGLLTCGSSIENAFNLALTCEWAAEIQWRCLCAGKISYLTDEQMEALRTRYQELQI